MSNVQLTWYVWTQDVCHNNKLAHLLQTKCNVSRLHIIWDIILINMVQSTRMMCTRDNTHGGTNNHATSIKLKSSSPMLTTLSTPPKRIHLKSVQGQATLRRGRGPPWMRVCQKKRLPTPFSWKLAAHGQNTYNNVPCTPFFLSLSLQSPLPIALKPRKEPTRGPCQPHHLNLIPLKANSL